MGTYAQSDFFYGRVAYTHGPGIDAPLSLIRSAYSDSLAFPFPVVPTTDWSGKYDGGTGRVCVQLSNDYTGTGTSQVQPVTWGPGETPTHTDSTSGGSAHCVEIDWPARTLWHSYDRRTNWTGPPSWMGSLLQHARDNSGQLYRRNRYYDPSTGVFTQEDPIGLAGGVNLYGFADGDPVTYSDPYGLCPNPTAMGLGSLQCATQDFVEAARRFPAAVLRGAWEAAKNPFVQQIALNAVPVARGVRAAAPLRAAAQRAANAAQALKPRPGMAAALEVGGDISTATSGRQVLNPTVQGWVDEGIAAGKQGFGGRCAETNCISNAMNAGVNPSGGRISTAAVGRAGSARHGTAIPPCANCQHVLGRAGVTYVP